MTNSGMLAAVATAAGVTAAEPITVDAAFMAQHFPETARALRAEGAEAERTRMLGIEKVALPGHEAIIAAHKADGSKTPADAAMAIIAAENATRGKMLAALDADEKLMKGLRSEPANGLEPARNSTEGLSGEALWKAEFAKDPALAKEFSSEAAYCSYRKMQDSGRVKIMGEKRAA